MRRFFQPGSKRDGGFAALLPSAALIEKVRKHCHELLSPLALSALLLSLVTSAFLLSHIVSLRAAQLRSHQDREVIEFNTMVQSEISRVSEVLVLLASLSARESQPAKSEPVPRDTRGLWSAVPATTREAGVHALLEIRAQLPESKKSADTQVRPPVPSADSGEPSLSASGGMIGFHIVAGEPRDQTASLTGFLPGIIPQLRAAMEEAARRNIPVLSSPITFPNGWKGALMLTPLRSSRAESSVSDATQAPDAYLAFMLSTDELISRLWGSLPQGSSIVAVSDRGPGDIDEILYPRNLDQLEAAAVLGARSQTAIDVAGHAWAIHSIRPPAGVFSRFAHFGSFDLFFAALSFPLLALALGGLATWYRKKLHSQFRDMNARVEQLAAQLRTISEHSPLGMLVMTMDGGCIYSNTAFQQMCGVTGDQLLGQTWTGFIHGDDRERVTDEFARALVQRSSFESQVRISPENRTPVRATFKGVPMQDRSEFLGYMMLVTEVPAKRKSHPASNDRRTKVVVLAEKSEFSKGIDRQSPQPDLDVAVIGDRKDLLKRLDAGECQVLFVDMAIASLNIEVILREIRDRAVPIKVVACSGEVDPVVDRFYASLGCALTITKDSLANDLPRLVRELLAESDGTKTEPLSTFGEPH